MNRTLTENQQEAVDKLAKLRVGALFMACGTGKTQAACALIETVQDIDCVMWLCPCAVIDNLREELARCALPHDVHICGIESIGASDRIYLRELDFIKQHRCVFLVLDESIKIKNPCAKRTRRILSLAPHSSYRLILNGTPVTKNIMDIYTQMTFLSPKILPVRGWYEFRDRYCNYTQHKVNGRVTKTIITGYSNVDNLLALIKPYVFSCNLELKVSKRYHQLFWYLDFDEEEAYKALKESLFERYTDSETDEVNILAILQKLQQSYSLARNKWKLLDETINDKSIVFCKYIQTREEVQKRYPKATVLTYGKGSFGLNLQNFNRIIYFDKTFDYAFREQSEGRIYRNGQTLECEYFDLTGDVGLEHMIDACINTKESLVQHFKKEGKKAIEEV